MTPTDDELNEAAARACGYQPGGRSGIFAMLVLRPDTGELCAPPDFCNDRNALPMLWKALQKAHETTDTAISIAGHPDAYRDWLLTQRPADVPDRRWWLITAPPRCHVIAALKALDCWRDEWDSEF